MIFLILLLIVHTNAIPKHSFNMYRSKNHVDGYCLADISDGYPSSMNSNRYFFGDSHATIPYCFRPRFELQLPMNPDFENALGTKWTFKQLKDNNVTSDMLLTWSATIEVAEEYEIYLQSDDSSLMEAIFHNCTSEWFGLYCYVKFDDKSDRRLQEIIGSVHQSKTRVNRGEKVACYQHHQCQTELTCLDWREICDGKNDCFDGSDENNCGDLESNVCAPNEYRCYSGHCIPMEFLQDDVLNADCLDRSDEYPRGIEYDGCSQNANFRCEEYRCYPGLDQFPCGDGQCTNGLSRCFNGRSKQLHDDLCSNMTACQLFLYHLVEDSWCRRFCNKINCIELYCREPFEFLSIPPLLGHITFIFSGQNLINFGVPLPSHVCYDESRCHDYLSVKIYINNRTCRSIDDIGLNDLTYYDNFERLVEGVNKIFRRCSRRNQMNIDCDSSNMYQCSNASKCILKQHLLDGMIDCPFGDDETFNESCSLPDRESRLKCWNDPQERCFSPSIVQDNQENCPLGEDEFHDVLYWRKTHIYFPHICDGNQDLLPIVIDKKNVTDETECETWPCNNFYTRCDGFWRCKNGADEANCSNPFCPVFHHTCINPVSPNELSCLPLDHAGNDKIDCLGGTDEQSNRYQYDQSFAYFQYHCWNSSRFISISKLCNSIVDCSFGDDESMCKHVQWTLAQNCIDTKVNRTSMEKFLCTLTKHWPYSRVQYFTVKSKSSFPFKLESKSVRQLSTQMKSISPIRQIGDRWVCLRGVPIRFRSNQNESHIKCLCPPSYYGHHCQYQNQRVSLLVRLRFTSDWRHIFVILITLIDENRSIQSYEQIEYLPIRDCQMKYHIFLLYRDRPKNVSSKFFVQVDIFDTNPFKLRASWIFPLPFLFLPIQRLSLLLKVPHSTMNAVDLECQSQCVNGKCMKYINDETRSYCFCNRGWSGLNCDRKQSCDHCAIESLCLDSSICLCSQNRYGPRCFLSRTSCHKNSCANGGRCVPIDGRTIQGPIAQTRCICPEGYAGDRCEIIERQTQISITFHSDLNIPSSLLIHLITTQSTNYPIRTSLMKRIRFGQDKLLISTNLMFHIAFVQISNQYYLLLVRESPMGSSKIVSEVHPSHYCPLAKEVFNQTIAQQHLLKRIKHYHELCSTKIELACFYDEMHLCLCTVERMANCLEFDHQMTYDCQGSNICENGGQCFQDDEHCPTAAFCACPLCYFGSKCQFTTKGSTLSLDIILGYHLDRHLPFSEQPVIIIIACTLTIFIFLIGIIDSFFCFCTFRQPKTRQVGCGTYLLTSSIISIIIFTLFSLKVMFLIISQLKTQLFIVTQCLMIDYILRCLLAMIDWLGAFVAIERALNILQGTQFQKRRSRRVAKRVVLFILTFTSFSFSYEPFFRQLTIDKDEDRTWCVTNYSSSVQWIDWFLTIFHVATPFTINCISAIIIIIIATRTRSNSQRSQSFKEHLNEQIQRHKHLLISPCILIMLCVPRLFIAFHSGCMQSTRQSWLYFLGYLISYLPPMMTFIIFVLPSETYRDEFIESLRSMYLHVK